MCGYSAGISASPRDFDQSGVVTPAAETLVAQNVAQKRDVVFDAGDLAFAERRVQTIDRFLSRRRMRDHFRDHRVVVHRHFAAALHTGVDANALGKSDVRQARPVDGRNFLRGFSAYTRASTA